MRLSPIRPVSFGFKIPPKTPFNENSYTNDAWDEVIKACYDNGDKVICNELVRKLANNNDDRILAIEKSTVPDYPNPDRPCWRSLYIRVYDNLKDLEAARFDPKYSDTLYGTIERIPLFTSVSDISNQFITLFSKLAKGNYFVPCNIPEPEKLLDRYRMPQQKS